MRSEHLIGSTKVGARGQIVLPKSVRDACGIKTGETLVIMAHRGPMGWGIKIIKPERLLEMMDHAQEARDKIQALARNGTKAPTPRKGNRRSRKARR